MRDLDDALHDLFTDLATQAPVPVALADGVRRRAHQRKQRVAAIASAAAVVAAAGTGTVVARGTSHERSPQGTDAGPERTVAPTPTATAQATLVPGREGSLLRNQPARLTLKIPADMPPPVDEAPIARALTTVKTAPSKFPVIGDLLLGANGEGYRSAPKGCTTGMQLSANGEWVACAKRGRVDIFRLSTGVKHTVTLPGSRAECIAELNNDASKFLTQCGAAKGRRIIDVASGGSTELPSDVNMQWSPDGSLLIGKTTADLLAEKFQHFIVVDPATGASRTMTATGGEDLYNQGMSISRDGKTVVGIATSKADPAQLLLVSVALSGGQVTRVAIDPPSSSVAGPDNQMPVNFYEATADHKLIYDSFPSQDLVSWDPATKTSVVLVRLPKVTPAPDLPGARGIASGRYALDLIAQLADR